MKRHARLALLPLLAASLCSAADLAPLKQRYLSCARDAAERRLPLEEAAACSQASDLLLQQGFGGDLARMLAWWRSAQAPLTFEQAQAHYDAGRYAQAYAGFAGLADCGHREATRIALQMRQFGPRLYNTSFLAGPQQLQRWRRTLERTATAGGESACDAAPADAGKASQPRPSAVPVDPSSEIWRHQGVG